MNYEKDYCIERLKAWFKDVDTVYTSVQHVSKSGMTRDIKLISILDNEPFCINYLVAGALDNKIKNGGVRVGGCGMDMGFHIVYELSQVLGIKLNQRWI